MVTMPSIVRARRHFVEHMEPIGQHRYNSTPNTPQPFSLSLGTSPLTFHCGARYALRLHKAHILVKEAGS